MASYSSPTVHEDFSYSTPKTSLTYSSFDNTKVQFQSNDPLPPKLQENTKPDAVNMGTDGNREPTQTTNKDGSQQQRTRKIEHNHLRTKTRKGLLERSRYQVQIQNRSIMKINQLNAIRGGKRVIPSVMVKNNLARKRVTPKIIDHVIPMKDLIEWKREEPRISLSHREIFKYSGQIGKLSVEILNAIWEEITLEEVNFNKLDELFGLLLGIPQNIKRIYGNTKYEDTAKDKAGKELSIYREEMKSEWIMEDTSRNENTEKEILRKIENSIRKNNLSGAIGIIEDQINENKQEPVISNSFSQIQQLMEMHDNTANLTGMTEIVSNEDHPEINLTEYEVRKSLNSLNRKSTEDIFGWSVELLRKTIEQNPIIITLLTLILQFCLNECYYPKVMFEVKMIAIPKPGKPGKIRPISIPSTFRKLISRIVLFKYEEVMRRNLHPNQYGVGNSLGIETIIYTIEGSIDAARLNKEDITIAQLDLSSAYNKVNRVKMIEILKNINLNRRVINYFIHMLSEEKLEYYDGNAYRLIPNTKGIAQGDICSPILFSLYIAEALNAVNRSTNERASSLSSSNIWDHTINKCETPQTLAYLDDIFIIAQNDQIMARLLEILVNKLEEKEMIINFDKCHILSIDKEGEMKMNGHIEINHSDKTDSIDYSEHLEALGSIITANQTERDQHFINTGREAIAILEYSTKLKAQFFISIARQCIATRLTHLLRTMHITESIIKEFDSTVMKIVCNKFKITTDETLLPMISKPFSKGGLSIASLSSQRKIILAGVMQELLKINHIRLLSKTIQESTNLAVTTRCGVFHLIPELPMNMTNAHEEWIKEESKEFEEIYNRANNEQKTLLMALTKDVGTSTWLKITPAKSQMNNEEFTESIRYRLGIEDDVMEYTKLKISQTQPESKNGENFKCPICGNKMVPHHYANCQSSGPLRTTRHTIIKKLLGKLLAEIPCIQVKIEDTNLEHDDKQFIPDITVTLLDNNITLLERKYNLTRNPETKAILRFGIDLVISDIYATSLATYRRRQFFADAGETEKWNHYKAFNETSQVKIIPFGLSSVGGAGSTAYDIVKFIKETANRQKKTISIQDTMEKIATIIEVTRYKMKQQYRLIINERTPEVKEVETEGDETECTTPKMELSTIIQSTTQKEEEEDKEGESDENPNNNLGFLQEATSSTGNNIFDFSGNEEQEEEAGNSTIWETPQRTEKRMNEFKGSDRKRYHQILFDDYDISDEDLESESTITTSSDSDYVPTSKSYLRSRKHY